MDAKVGGNRKANEEEAREQEKEMEARTELEETAAGEGVTQKKKGAGSIEDLARVIKDINQRVREEMREIRKEVRQSIGDVRREMEAERTRTDKVMDELKKMIRQGLSNVESQMHHGTKGWEKESEEKEDLSAEMEKARQCFGMVFEEMDKNRREWEDKMTEIQNASKDQMKGIYDHVEEKISMAMKGDRKKAEKEVETEMEKQVMVHEEDGMNVTVKNVGTPVNNEVKDMPLPKFGAREEENPRRFLEEFSEFVKARGIGNAWRTYWFQKCLGEEPKLWFEAVGKEAANFEQMEEQFVNRYWGPERQSEVIRKFYSPWRPNNKFKNREQYLLTAYRENKYLDQPLSERSLVGAISRQMGAEVSKHVASSEIVTVRAFAKMLSVWEEVDNDQGGGNYRNNQVGPDVGWRGPGRGRDAEERGFRRPGRVEFEARGGNQNGGWRWSGPGRRGEEIRGGAQDRREEIDRSRKEGGQDTLKGPEGERANLN